MAVPIPGGWAFGSLPEVEGIVREGKGVRLRRAHPPRRSRSEGPRGEGYGHVDTDLAWSSGIWPVFPNLAPSGGRPNGA